MPAPALPGPVVDAAWLAEQLANPLVVVLDASWHMPTSGRDARAEWQAERIPGAWHFDYDHALADQASPLPRMLPPPEQFTAGVQALGVNADSIVIVYDTNGNFSAPRAWWMFRAMGHDAVALLDGGLPAWQAAGHAVETSAPVPPEPGDFQASLRPGRFVSSDDVLARHDDGTTAILDARSAPRFDGGHIPGSANLPYADLLADGRFKPLDDIKTRFDEVLDPDRPLICSCGSGVTACVVALGAAMIGHEAISVYDGSWTEWGARDDLPKATS